MSKAFDGIGHDLSQIPDTVKDKVMGLDFKKSVLKYLPYVLFGYASDKLAWLYRMENSGNILQRLLDTLNDAAKAFYNPLPSFYPKDLLASILGASVLCLAVYCKSLNAKKFRHGVEYGSARWSA